LRRGGDWSAAGAETACTPGGAGLPTRRFGPVRWPARLPEGPASGRDLSVGGGEENVVPRRMQRERRGRHRKVHLMRERDRAKRAVHAEHLRPVFVCGGLSRPAPGAPPRPAHKRRRCRPGGGWRFGRVRLGLSGRGAPPPSLLLTLPMSLLYTPWRGAPRL
jgi:hypothetical protein